MKIPLWLKLKLLWLRRAYTFNWAHKPLCRRFEEDVLRLGRLNLCRSCTSAYAGLALGALAALLFTPPKSVLMVVYFSVLILVMLFSEPRLYKKLPRRLRDLLRFLAGALIPASIYLGLMVDPWAGLLGLSVMLAFWWNYFRLRKARKLEECNGCFELGRGAICSGFAYQAEHIRRFEREATEMLMHAGHVPACIRKRT